MFNIYNIYIYNIYIYNILKVRKLYMHGRPF